MEDQFNILKKLKIPTAVIKSADNDSNGENGQIFQSMVDPKSDLKILYVTPEKLAQSAQFMAQLTRCYEMKRLSCVAIDEVFKCCLLFPNH